MPFDPAVPEYNAELVAIMFRNQFNGLKEIIDAQAAALTALQTQVSVLQAQVAATPAGPQGPPGNDGAPGQTGPIGPQGPPFSALNMRGDWTSTPDPAYATGDVVAYQSEVYVAAYAPPSNGSPMEESAWRMLSIQGPPGEVTTLQLNTALQTQASRNCDAVQFFDASGLSPEGQTIVGYLNTLLASLHSPV